MSLSRMMRSRMLHLLVEEDVQCRAHCIVVQLIVGTGQDGSPFLATESCTAQQSPSTQGLEDERVGRRQRRRSRSRRLSSSRSATISSVTRIIRIVLRNLSSLICQTSCFWLNLHEILLHHHHLRHPRLQVGHQVEKHQLLHHVDLVELR